MWSLTTRRFIGKDGQLTGVEVADVEWKNENGKWLMEEIPGSERVLEADLAFLSMGFVHPVHEGLVKELGLELDQRGNVRINDQFMTSKPGVFAAGDAANGASLVVTAIAKGRSAAEQVNRFLKQ
jgi:glutamate synthase (NADPH/NADH) small chain